MKNLIFKAFIILTISLSIISCTKVLIEKNQESEPMVCFNQVWQTMQNKYIFFDYKNVNWDSIKTIYKPQVNENMTDKQLFDLLSKMLASVKDGHTSLYAPIDTFRYNYANGYNKNYNETFVKQKYLIPNNFSSSETIEYCVLHGNIGYMNYSSFKNELTQKNIDGILNSLLNTKGIIIDIRNNTGGDNKNIFRLLEHFVSTTTKIGMSVEKKDANMNSFTAPTEIKISPQGVNYSKPIVVLTNRAVYSSANIFAGFISQLPQVKIIGDITGGGTGLPTSNDLPNGWRFRYSSSIIRLANGTDFEEGILPTIKVTTDSISQALTGKDAIIERALLEIK